MTRAIITLAIVTLVTYSVRTFSAPGTETLSPGVTLAVGFLLIAALQAGHIVAWMKMPQLTGYIIAGLIAGPELLGFISARSLESLALVKGVSVGLIALLAGCELNFKRLRPRLPAVGTYGLASLAAAGLLLFILFFVLTGLIPVTQNLGPLERMTIALLCANVLCAFSPPVVIAMIAEAQSAGPITDLWLSVAVLTDLVIVVWFSMSNAVARLVFPRQESGPQLDILLMHIFGSIGAGILIGLVLAWYARVVGSRVGLFVFVMLFAVAEAGTAIHLDPLLVGLTAGLFVENISPIGGEDIIEATGSVTLPVYAVFFAVIGAEIQFRAFLHVAAFALAAAVVRAAGLYLGTQFAARRLKSDSREPRLAVAGMLPQAGIALALATLVLNSFEPWGRAIGTVLLGSVVVNQIVGPIVFRMAMDRSGETGAGGKAEETGGVVGEFTL